MLNKLCHLMTTAAALALLAAVVLIALDIGSRQLGFGSIPMVRIVITTYLVPMVVFLSLPAIQQKQAHIEVDTIFNLLNARGQQLLRIIGWLFMLLLFGFWALQTFTEAVEMFIIGERIAGVEALRVWPARFLVFAGLAAAFMVVVMKHPFASPSAQKLESQL